MIIKRISKPIFSFINIIFILLVFTIIVRAEDIECMTTQENLNLLLNNETKSEEEKIQKHNYEFVKFFINYKSEALDFEGNVGGQNPTYFTPALWESDVKNATPDTQYYIAGESTDNSYEANKQIRKLVGDKKDGSIYLTTFPTDEYIFKELAQYVNTLSIDGKSIKTEELNTEHYEVRWYVFKLHGNFWHIDGKLVRKEGQIIITKTFEGIKDGIEEQTGFSFDKNERIIKTNFNITMQNGEDIKILDLDNYTELINASTNDKYILTYKWKVKVKYGIIYTIMENNYNLQYYATLCSYEIQDPKATTKSYTNQSQKQTIGNETKILGYNNYADDSEELLDETQMLKLNFTNTLSPIDSYTIMPETGGEGNFKICLMGIFLIGTSFITLNNKGFLERNSKK